MFRLSSLRCYLLMGGIVVILASTGIVFAFHAYSSSSSNAPNQSVHIQNSSDFVIRSGAQLFLHGKPFRFAGANIYWLGLDENVGGIDYPTQFRVDDALTSIVA